LNDDENIDEFFVMAELFENKNAKILSKGVYVEKKHDKNIIRSKTQLRDTFEHTSFKKWNKITKDLDNNNFIMRWTVNNPDIKQYDDKDIYPNK